MLNAEKIDIAKCYICEIFDDFRRYEGFDSVVYIIMGILDTLVDVDPIDELVRMHDKVSKTEYLDDYDMDVYADIVLDMNDAIDDVESWNASFGIN